MHSGVVSKLSWDLPSLVHLVFLSVSIKAGTVLDTVVSVLVSVLALSATIVLAMVDGAMRSVTQDAAVGGSLATGGSHSITNFVSCAMYMLICCSCTLIDSIVCFIPSQMLKRVSIASLFSIVCCFTLSNPFLTFVSSLLRCSYNVSIYGGGGSMVVEYLD